MGHGIFWEDSIETNNIVEGNLVMRTMISSSLLESDLSPAAMWITHPKNTIRNNSVIGSDAFGYWYDLPGAPNGPSAAFGEGICPKHEKFGVFENNVSHGHGIGLRIYPNYIPLTHPCKSGLDKYKGHELNPPDNAILRNTLLYGNNTGFFTKKIGFVTLDNFTFLSNCRSIFYLHSTSKVREYAGRITNSEVIGQSEYSDFHNIVIGRVLELGVDGVFIFENLNLINFHDKGLMGTCHDCDPNQEQGKMMPKVIFKNINAINSSFSTMILWNEPKKGRDLIISEDSSLYDIFIDD